MKITDVRIELTQHTGLLDRVMLAGWSWNTSARLADGEYFVKWGMAWSRRRAAKHAFAALAVAFDTPVKVCHDIPCPPFEAVTLDASVPRRFDQ